MGGFLAIATSSTSPTLAGAATPQNGGDDVPTLLNGWTWTYDQTFVYDEPGTADLSVDETETQTVGSPTSFDGYSVYPVTLGGSVTGGGGSADGYSATVKNGSITGIEYLRTSDLGLVYESQTQDINLTVESVLSESVDANIVLQPSPVWRMTDFRLHNGDTWQDNENIAYSGSVTYGGVESGSSAIGPGVFTLDGQASDTSATISPPIGSVATDEVQVSDPNSGASAQDWWAPKYSNFGETILNLPLSGSTATLTDTLAASSTPGIATSVSENLPSTANGMVCAGDPFSVSGALSTGASGTPVTVTLDESPLNPGQAETVTTTTGSGGLYTATGLTAPAPADGWQKAGVLGAWGVQVSAGTARNTATLEVEPVDCTTLGYTGSTSAEVGSTATVSAVVNDLATGGPLAGAPVTFTLNGQTANATTGANGVASTSILVAAPVGASTVTASYGGSSTETTSSATSPFTVNLAPTSTSVVPSEPTATIGDPVTFTATVVPAGPVPTPLTGTVQFAVDGSNLGSPVAVAADGTATSAADPTMSLGTHAITATYSGTADYAGSGASIASFDVHNPLTPTGTSLSVTPGTSVFGQPVSLTATVSAGTGTPDGAVSFYDNATTLLGTATLNGDATDQATLSVTSLPVGSASITADYDGDNNVTFAPSNSAPVDETVQLSGSTTTVTSSQNPSVSGQGVTFDVSVAPAGLGAGTPTGTVQITVNGASLGTETLSGGAASVTDNSLGAGSYTVTATYSGDAGFAAGSGGLTQVVTQDATATVLDDSPNPSVQNQTVTFTATVSPVAPGGGSPTGTVTFLNGSTPIGAATLSAGADGDQASIELSNLDLGDNLITASYAGDSNFIASASATVDQSVQAAPPIVGTSTAVTSSTSPSVFGQSVSFSATVTPASGSEVPTGTVQFAVDGTNLGGPVTLDANGEAQSPSISSLAAGGHEVTAAYSGISGAGVPFAFSASGQTFTQQVQQATASVSGTPSANPAAYGQSETFTATVSAVSPGAGTPTGTVQFRLDGVLFGSPATLVSGVATSGPATSLTPGTHTVSYVTSGDPNFAGTNGSFTFVVTTIPTTTVLTATPNPVVFGQPETLVATVSYASGIGTPDGTVTFNDGSTMLSTVAVVQKSPGVATATFTISTLAAGSHTLTASYSGSATYQASVSSQVTLLVAGAATSISVAATTVQLSLASLLAPASVVSLGPLTATITSGGVPVAGVSLTFAANPTKGTPVVCTATTNAKGVATCAATGVNELAVVTGGGVKVTFAGNASYLASAGSAGLIDVIL
jgi:hypothetical protein